MKEKGYTAEEYTFPVRIYLGRMENILRTVTSMWSAIIRALGFLLPFCRECWSFSEIRGFCLYGDSKNPPFAIGPDLCTQLSAAEVPKYTKYSETSAT